MEPGVMVIIAMVALGLYLKGRFDGAEKVRRENRTLNESRRKK